MSTALYQKYRPKTFAEVINQKHIKITLQNAIVQGKVGHAYLFYGPRAVGKTTTARLLAKAVNCEQRKEGESEPCNMCEACKEINEDRSFDIIEIDAASHTGVDNVRENIIANARVATTKRKYKVFIIDEVHMLSISAFNALLKTLEEPPANVIFILATTEIHKVPATIISRCQRFDFKKISNPEMIERLKLLVSGEGKQVDDGVLENITRQAGGYVRDAESLLTQVLTLDENHITKEQAEIIIPSSNFNLIAEFVGYVVNKDQVKSLAMVNRLVEESIDLSRFSIDLIEFLRKLLLSKISNTLDNFALSLDADLENEVMKIKEKTEITFLTRALNTFIIRSKELKNTTIVQLPLEMAIVELINDESRIKNQESRITKQETGNMKQGTTPTQQVQSGSVAGIPVKKFNFDQPVVQENPVVQNQDIAETQQVNITFDEIMQKWQEVVAFIVKNEHGLSFMLKTARPQKLTGAVLEVAFKHKFHCEAVRSHGKQEVFEKIISDIVGVQVKTKCYVDLTVQIDPVKVAPEIPVDNQELQNVSEETEGNITGVLDAFGGQVIE